MYCPCSKCCNRRHYDTSTVWHHLTRRGFMGGYKLWFMHGEDESMVNYGYTSATYEEPNIQEDVVPQQEVDHMVQMVTDRFHDTFDEYSGQPSSQNRDFYNTMSSANKPLYGGCRDGVSALSAATRLMNIKTDYNLSEDCVDRIASWGQYLCPEENSCLETYYDVQKLVSGLGLPYETFDVCIDNCMIFWRGDANRKKCSFCGEMRYEAHNGNKPVARKKMWYLPLTERLRRLYQSPKTASSMRWHAEHQTDGDIKHPADAKAWKHFQAVYPEFAAESRNVYHGLSEGICNRFCSLPTT